MNSNDIIRISPVATKAGHTASLAITRELILEKARAARESLRRREIHIFHTGDEDPLQRMLNAFQPASYVQPHRHMDPPKAEAIVVLQGSLGFIGFHDNGSPDSENTFLADPAKGVVGFDVRAGVWHTFFALEPDTVVFEVKAGPYEARADKGFAPWAPKEGNPESLSYLANLEDWFRNRFELPPRPWLVPGG
ncbi:MAG: hypothetical protein AMXMBFR84_28720 [Candidatus Hydrogenedentota bacterium]